MADIIARDTSDTEKRVRAKSEYETEALKDRREPSSIFVLNLGCTAERAETADTKGDLVLRLAPIDALHPIADTYAAIIPRLALSVALLLVELRSRIELTSHTTCRFPPERSVALNPVATVIEADTDERDENPASNRASP